jgi:hypothetical protein
LRILSTFPQPPEDDDNNIPNSTCMPVNFRTIDLTRFGIGCKDTEKSHPNSLDKSTTEREGEGPLFLLEHTFILVFTSFEIVNVADVKEVTLMKSLLGNDYNPNNLISHTQAVPLSLSIINKAMTWLQRFFRAFPFTKPKWRTRIINQRFILVGMSAVPSRMYA